MTKIREGYKETEIGVIPEDWEVSILNDISNNKGEYGIGAKAVDYKVNKPRYLRITDIDEYGRLIKDNEYKTIEEDEYEDYLLKKDDLVFARTGNTTGKTYLYNSNDGELVFAGFLIKFSINKSKANSEYVRQYCFTKRYWDWVKQSSTRSGQPGINSKQYGELKLPLPPLLEQQRIAEILSTTDSHIEKLDKTIEDYQLLKKGMMKKLLTKGIGHTEFKETEIGRIPKDWEVVALNNLGDTFNGLSGVTKDDFGSGAPFIPYMNIFSNTKIDVNRMDFVNLDNKKKQNTVKFGDIFFTTSSETVEEAGMSSVLLDEVPDMYLNSFCFGYRLFNFDSLRPEFARFLLRVDYVRKEIQKLAQGSTRFNLSKGNILKIKTGLPSIAEQLEIANQLSNLESSIDILIKNRNDYIDLKKSLMEKLLTGKVRTC